MTFEEKKASFEKAYQLMDEPLVDTNCGLLCNFHCCRSHEADEALGMYLLPFEYETMQSKVKDYEVHSSYQYDLPKGIKKQYYIFCSDDSGCLRTNRPIQCRTYPFEPHYLDGVLSLVIEKDQLHHCPLIHKREQWRPEFVTGIYEGWKALLDIEAVKGYIQSQSETRHQEKNILFELKPA